VLVVVVVVVVLLEVVCCGGRCGSGGGNDSGGADNVVVEVTVDSSFSFSGKFLCLKYSFSKQTILTLPDCVIQY